MPAEPHIDMAYLDADKGNYIAYWEELVPRMRPGGLVVTDNVLFHGGVTDPLATGATAATLRRTTTLTTTGSTWSASAWSIASTSTASTSTACFILSFCF